MTTNNCDNYTNPVSVSTGGTGSSSFTAFSPLCAGTTTTGVWQNVGTGSTGQILTSAGAAALPSFLTSSFGNYLSVTPTITSLQIKSLNATPITLVSAAGSGTIIFPLALITKFNYGGTNAFTGSGNISVAYNSAGKNNLYASVFTTTQMTSTTTQFYPGVFSWASTASTNAENLDLVIYKEASPEYAGNAANNNTITIQLIYSILTL